MLNYKTGLRVSKSKKGWQDRKDKAMMMMMSQVPIQKEKNKKNYRACIQLMWGQSEKQHQHYMHFCVQDETIVHPWSGQSKGSTMKITQTEWSIASTKWRIQQIKCRPCLKSWLPSKQTIMIAQLVQPLDHGLPHKTNSWHQKAKTHFTPNLKSHHHNSVGSRDIHMISTKKQSLDILIILQITRQQMKTTKN